MTSWSRGRSARSWARSSSEGSASVISARNSFVRLSPRRTARDGRARDWDPLAPNSLRRPTARLDPIAVLPIASRPPSWLHVRPSEHVSDRFRVNRLLLQSLSLLLPSTYGGARANAMWGSAEARLAWSNAPSAPDHNCKPGRSMDPGVVFARAPVFQSASVPVAALSTSRRFGSGPRLQLLLGR